MWQFSPCITIPTSRGNSHLAWPFPPRVVILTSRDHSHLAWQFSPHMTIPTSHGNSHLMWPFPPRVAILTSRDHSHLMWQFSPCVAILTSCDHSHLVWQFSSHVLPSTPQNHLMYIHEVHEVTLHYIKPNSRNFHHSQFGHHWSNIYTVQKSHLATLRVSVELSSPPLKVTSHTYSHLTYTFSPHIHILTSRTYSHLACPLHHSKSPWAHLEYTFSPHIHILTSRAPSTQNNIFHLALKNSQKSHAATPIPSIRYLLRATN